MQRNVRNQMEFDEAFQLVGSCGRFQFTTVALLFILNIAFGTQMLLMVIVGATPNKNMPSEANLETIVTEWNLYDEKWVTDLMASLFMAGYIAGMIIFGQLPDLYGRKLLTILTFIGMLVCSFSSAFCTNWKEFAVTRFMAGMFAGVASPTNYVLLCELIRKELRGKISMLYAIFFPLGPLLLALLGYTVQSWRHICIIVSTVPLLLIPLLIFLVPESPRWLYSVGKIARSEQILQTIAQKNGKDDSVQLSTNSNQSKQKELRKYTIIDLCRVRKLLKQLLTTSFVWFSASLVYYGLSLDLSDLTSNVYIAIALSASIEIPSFLLVLVIVDRKWFGRKGTVLYLLLLCGSAMTGLIFLDGTQVTMSTTKTVLGLISKLSVAGVFATLFLFTSEMFPTQLCVVAVGVCSICARIGAIISPFVPLLVSTAPYMPYVIFASAPAVAASLVLLLPETLGRQIPKMPSLTTNKTTEQLINSEDNLSYGSFERDDQNESNANSQALAEDNGKVTSDHPSISD